MGTTGPLLYRRKLKLEAKFESGSSCLSLLKQSTVNSGTTWVQPAPPYLGRPLRNTLF